MKKFICIITLIIVCCFIIIFPGCSESAKYSETFAGYLSEDTYDSEKSAVNAFIKEQLNGTTSEYTLKNYSCDRTLTSREIADLELGEDVETANFVTVNYTDENYNQHQTALYVIKANDGFRYFAPLPKTGEAVTASYYDSVLSNKAYENCTVTTTYACHAYSAETTYLQVFKFDYTKAYFKQTIPSMKVDFYMEETLSGFEYYSKLPLFGDGNYYSSEEANKKIKEKYGDDYYLKYVLLKGGKEYNLDSFSTISELSEFIYAANFDSSYFVKTDYGFCMPFEKFKEAVYCMAGLLGENAEEAMTDIDTYISSLNIRYYVTDGRLSKIDYLLQALLSDDPKDFFSIEMHSLFTDFGSTEIKLPV